MNESAIPGNYTISLPPPFDLDAGERTIDAIKASSGAIDPAQENLIRFIGGCSPYLARLSAHNGRCLINILNRPFKETLDAVCAIADSAHKTDSRTDQLRILRMAKQEAALAIAVADLSGVVDVFDAARANSRFADAAVNAAFKAAQRNAGANPGEICGIAIIAMGKLGGFELNYSSDVDLVVVYDVDAMPAAMRDDAQKTVNRIIRDAVDLLQHQTADGYVFRTDLRLRPDPGVTPLAITVDAAEAYYESFGQNWERMAYIRARASGGDIELGRKFLNSLRPFVWRRYLDFAAIEDVKAVKRQIHSSKGGGALVFEGHDIKTGRGGIREVEFFAQTQQLILGGKDETLRAPSTLDAIASLAKAGHVDDRQRAELSTAYHHLRNIEHRLQMINDEQTHKIPISEENIARLARFSGYENATALRDDLLATMTTVRDHYDELFNADAEIVQVDGPFVFTGVEDDPATIDHLTTLGFKRASDVSAAIRRWHAGGLRATRNERARLILTQLINPLLLALSKSGDPDISFFAFEKFISGLPASVQVFSLLLNNTEVFTSLIQIMTISPYLGRELSQHTNYVEQLLESNWSEPPLGADEYQRSLERVIDREADYEGHLNAVRRWAGENKFIITAQLVTEILPAQIAAKHLTAIADVCIQFLTEIVEVEMVGQHGRIDGELGVVALGRLGASEMTATSDIDLMFIYKAADDASSSGAKSLSAGEYYGRFVRRIITALSVATQEGALYDVDMQLRPSGRSGPAAVSFSAFQRYYRRDAWTWEEMAMTRARIVSSRGAIGVDIETELASMLARKRDKADTAANVIDMRNRLLSAKPAKSAWDVKHAHGGLTDIAFICQYLWLVSTKENSAATKSTQSSIEWFARNGELSHDRAALLATANDMFESILQFGRAATGGTFEPHLAGENLLARVCEITGEPTIETASARIDQLQGTVRDVFGRVLSETA